MRQGMFNAISYFYHIGSLQSIGFDAPLIIFRGYAST